jgi:hypothetical protein
MKVESRVIVDQQATVNGYSGFVHTARHALGIDLIENRSGPRHVQRLGLVRRTDHVNVGSVTGAKS